MSEDGVTKLIDQSGQSFRLLQYNCKKDDGKHGKAHWAIGKPHRFQKYQLKLHINWEPVTL